MALARRLFARNLASEWDIFGNVAATHADVMGAEGRAEFRRLAEAEWAKVPPKKPGDARGGYDGGAFRIKSIMETLAAMSGDADAMAAVLGRDLSSEYDFLRIAETYAEAGRRDAALEWAERGVKAFPKGNDGRLRAFLAGEYQRRRRHDEALALVWEAYAEHPCLPAYREVKAYAERAGQWPRWRDKALALVTARYEAAKGRGETPIWLRPDLSLLVEILLWENDPEAAWAAARRGNCRPELWLKLADIREESQPMDALPVHRIEVTRLLDSLGVTPDYAAAVSHVRHVRELMARLGLAKDFPPYLDQLRMTYKRKRNFMKLLERVKPVA